MVFEYSNGKAQKVEAAPAPYEQIVEDAKAIDPNYDPDGKATEAHLNLLRQYYTGENLAKLLKANGIARLEDLPALKAGDLLSAIAQREARKEAKKGAKA